MLTLTYDRRELHRSGAEVYSNWKTFFRIGIIVSVFAGEKKQHICLVYIAA